MSVRVRTTPQADAQALAADAWWRENRSKAPGLFWRELTGALDLLEGLPEIGSHYKGAGIPGLRRVLLTKSRYHIYYVYDSEVGEVAVLSVWSAVRGRKPDFGDWFLE